MIEWCRWEDGGMCGTTGEQAVKRAEISQETLLVAGTNIPCIDPVGVESVIEHCAEGN
jgi:hypothetical protein